MTAVVVQPKGSSAARQHYADTIEQPVVLADHEDVLDREMAAELAAMFPRGEVAMWGVTPGANSANVKKWARAGVGDVVLFAAGGRFDSAGTIVATFHNPALAERLWGRDEKGQTWEYMYALDEIHPVDIPYPEFAEAVGYSTKWIAQGFMVLDQAKSEAAFDAFDLASSKHPTPVSEEQYEQALKQLEGPVDVVAKTSRRTEQQYLRSIVIPTPIADCDLCGRSFPREYLVAAHIKKRSACSYEEKTDIPAIVMAACTFGCDALYERGHITVDPDTWTIRVSTDLPQGTHPARAAQESAGKTFGRPDPARVEYFQWHREHVFAR